MIFFFHASILAVNPPFLWHKHIPVGHPRPFHFPRKLHFSRLTAWKAYGYWKEEVNTPLFDIIWRDGFLYFFVIFSMNAANVIIFSTVPEALRAFNLTLRWFNSLKFIDYLMFLFFTRPTLVLEVVLSCRLILNLRSAAVEGSAFKTKPAILPWSDNSKSRSYTNPSSSIILGEQSRSTELQVSPKFEREMKLEPNRARPESTWNAQTLYKY